MVLTYSIAKCKSSYYSVSYGATLFKLLYDIVHQKAAERYLYPKKQNANTKNATVVVIKMQLVQFPYY